MMSGLQRHTVRASESITVGAIYLIDTISFGALRPIFRVTGPKARSRRRSSAEFERAALLAAMLLSESYKMWRKAICSILLATGCASSNPPSPRDSQSAEQIASAAIDTYRASMQRLWGDLRTVFAGMVTGLRPNQRYLRSALEQSSRELAAIAQDLERVAESPTFSMKLCPACWEVDWNLSGEIDERDRRLLEVEQDASGAPIPEGDPRRRPTFHLDRGDVDWAQAMLSFQRASIEFLLAYDYQALDLRGRGPIRLRMIDASRLERARQLIGQGLQYSKRCRAAYLAETDDDHEWVPNPRQKNHPLPLPVDDQLYETWGAILGDLERMLEGREGLSLEQIARLSGMTAEESPRGFVDVSKLFLEPSDIVLNLGGDSLEKNLRSLLGRAYVSSMRPSPLAGRLSRMQSEIERGDESFSRKLRYLLWLN